MKLIDEVGLIVRQAAIESLDPEYLLSMNPAKTHSELEKREGYKELSETFAMVYDHAVAHGTPKSRAAGFVIGVFEDMLKHIIERNLKNKFSTLSSAQTTLIEGENSIQRMVERGNAVRADLEKMTQEYAERAATKGPDQLKAYLRYAADKWGTPAQKRSVEALVARITV